MFAFTFLDEARRQAGRLADAAGLGPQETPSRVVAEFAGARLRAYQPAEASGPQLLILAAPFKRAYIWDLLPQVSVVRRCRERGLRVYLLEWLPPGEPESGFGLAKYAYELPTRALDVIASEAGASAVVLAGHSLGGTFAAIYASLAPERVRGLALIDAGLAFGAHGGPLGRAVAALPHVSLVRRMVGSPVPGSVIDLLAVSAAPHVFEGQRWADLVACLGDPLATAVHRRVERWMLDELPMPGPLFEDILERLYREDRFRRGTLELGGHRAGLDQLQAPVLAVINPLGRVVPPESMLSALAMVPHVPTRVLSHDGGRGPALQHLGPLVAPLAHERLWPQILDWITTLP